jgi:hypothetical protein
MCNFGKDVKFESLESRVLLQTCFLVLHEVITCALVMLYYIPLEELEVFVCIY